jgi:RND family efflux transporter MFP subunit
MKKIIKIILIVLAVVAIIVKGKTLLQDRKQQIADESLPADESMVAHVVKATEGELLNKEPYLAQVVSDKSIKLSTKLAGFVEKVFVLESDVVKKGQPLVQIDSIELHSNIEALKATLQAQKSDLALARSIYNRNKKLYEVGGLAKEKLDMSKVALGGKNSIVQSTTQKINQAKHQLSYLQITAPFDGEVDALMLHQGDLAAAGKPILSLSNGKKKLIFSYAPTSSSSIQKGKIVSLDGENIGQIKAIYTTSKNGLVSAEVALEKSLDLPIGSSVNIEVLTNKKQGCIVPQNSILHKKDGLFVLEFKDGVFTPLKVTSLISNQNSLIISPCPTNPIAQESEVKLAKLPAFKNVEVIGDTHE